MNNPILKNFPPALKLLYYVIMMFLFMFIGSAVATVLGIFAFGIPMNSLQEIITNPTEEYVSALMWMNNLSQIFTFIFPVILFILFFGKDSINGLMLRPTSAVFILAAVAFILLANGVIDISSQLNKWLIPDGSSIEAWAKPMEEAAAKLTEAMLNAKGVGAMIVAFISIAVIPAVCEELAFRGVMQPLIAKSTRNIHIAVWATAIAFSVFHFQFYGLLPRIVLGALLGYLVVWTGSVWPAILAHFANNATAFIMYQSYGSLDSPEGTFMSEWYSFVISILVTVAFIFWFRKNSKWPWIGFEYLGITEKSNV